LQSLPAVPASRQSPRFGLLQRVLLDARHQGRAVQQVQQQFFVRRHLLTPFDALTGYRIGCFHL
jgi:hypothetical protein